MAVISAEGLSATAVSSFAKPKIVIDGNGLAGVQSATNAHLINPVKISNVEAYSTTKVRITFDRPMNKNSQLLDDLNYMLTPSSTNAAPIYHSSIAAESIVSPRYVDVVLDSEMTHGESYELEVATEDGPTSVDENPLDHTTHEATFTGLGVIPEILSVVAVGKNRVDVIFTEAMTDNSEIRSASNYSFDGGLTVLDVLNVSSDTVQLATSDQTPGELYTLTVVPT